VFWQLFENGAKWHCFLKVVKSILLTFFIFAMIIGILFDEFFGLSLNLDDWF